jgi:hypothetical protein
VTLRAARMSSSVTIPPPTLTGRPHPSVSCPRVLDE